METVVGYEQRRRIRSQIRILKKQQQELNVTKEVKKDGKQSYVRKFIPAESPAPLRKFTSKESSTPDKKSEEESSTPLRKFTSTESSTPVKKSIPFDQSNLRKINATESPVSVRKVYSIGNSANTQNTVKKTIPIENRPSVYTKKTDQVQRAAGITSGKKLRFFFDKTSLKKYFFTDSVTSSYGIGPTDEKGIPLFGLRALKKSSKPKGIQK